MGVQETVTEWRTGGSVPSAIHSQIPYLICDIPGSPWITASVIPVEDGFSWRVSTYRVDNDPDLGIVRHRPLEELSGVGGTEESVEVALRLADSVIPYLRMCDDYTPLSPVPGN